MAQNVNSVLFKRPPWWALRWLSVTISLIVVNTCNIRFNHFKTHSSGVFSTYTILYNHHDYLIPEHFLESSHSLSLSPSSWQLPICSWCLRIVLFWPFRIHGITHYAAFCGASFTQQNVFRAHPHCSTCPSFIHFLWQHGIPLHGRATYVYSFLVRGFGLFCVVFIPVTSAGRTLVSRFLLWAYVFDSLGHIPRSGIAVLW